PVSFVESGRAGGGVTVIERTGGVLSFGFPAATQVFVPGSHVPPFTQSAFVLHCRVGSKHAARSPHAATTPSAELAVRISPPQTRPAIISVPPPGPGLSSTCAPSGLLPSSTQSVTPVATSAAPATSAIVTDVDLPLSESCAAAASGVGGRCPYGSSVCL